jgi:hypothetical protein
MMINKGHIDELLMLMRLGHSAESKAAVLPYNCSTSAHCHDKAPIVELCNNEYMSAQCTAV